MVSVVDDNDLDLRRLNDLDITRPRKVKWNYTRGITAEQVIHGPWNGIKSCLTQYKTCHINYNKLYIGPDLKTFFSNKWLL